MLPLRRSRLARVAWDGRGGMAESWSECCEDIISVFFLLVGAGHVGGGMGASGIFFSDGAVLQAFVVLAGAAHDGKGMGASGIFFGDDVFAAAFCEGV